MIEALRDAVHLAASRTSDSTATRSRVSVGESKREMKGSIAQPRRAPRGPAALLMGVGNPEGHRRGGRRRNRNVRACCQAERRQRRAFTRTATVKLATPAPDDDTRALDASVPATPATILGAYMQSPQKVNGSRRQAQHGHKTAIDQTLARLREAIAERKLADCVGGSSRGAPGNPGDKLRVPMVYTPRLLKRIGDDRVEFHRIRPRSPAGAPAPAYEPVRHHHRHVRRLVILMMIRPQLKREKEHKQR